MSQQNDQWADGKASLFGLSGAFSNRRIVIEGGRFLVGRDPGQCQLVLDFPTISKRHAAIDVDPQGRATLTDLGSSNGTFVNGARISQCELRDGCQVAFGPGGDAAFTFRAPVFQQRPQPFTPPQHSTPPPPFTPPQQFVPPQPVYPPPPVPPPPPVIPPPVQTPNPPSPPQQQPPEVGATVVQPYTQTPAPVAGGMHVKSPPSNFAFGTGTSHVRAAQSPVIRMGRAPDNDIVFDSPAVSRYHATLTYTNQAQPVIADLGSTNGTFVNGEPLTEPRPISPTDLVYIGGFLLRVEGRDIKQHNLGASRIAAFHLSKDAGGRTILKDISLSLYPREFIGLMGPSGCGKSTLMDALNGFRPATSGAVFVNDLDLYRNHNALRRSIGYVPQRDILHEALTVERTLYYAAKLRLPESTPLQEIHRVVDEVIWTVGLQEQRTTQFRQLSGGQQKRLSLGLELVTKPSFIFLDEPTSPLDPVTTENMMVLFRRLADEGRIVIMVTHKFEKFETMHQVAMLTRGGRLAFFGPPQEALNYFGCQYPAEIYHRIESRDPDELSQTFLRSPQHQQYVGARMTEAQNLLGRSAPPVPPQQPSQDAERRAGLNQFKTLTRRYLEVKLTDKRNIISLLAQPILVAIVVAIIFSTLNEGKTLFVSAIVSVLFGTNNAVREIVGELPIYLRERLVNLKIPSYVFSKFAILSAISFIQCFLWVTILVIAQRLSGSDFFSLIIILYLTFLSGISIGLFISALVNSVEKALTALPLIVALQLVLSGFIVPLYEVNSPAGTIGGLGVMNAPAALMPMRWTMEALAHDISIEDPEAGKKIGTQMSLGFEASDSDSEIASTSRVRVFLDILMLVIFTGLFLILTMWALKRKDAL